MDSLPSQVCLRCREVKPTDLFARRSPKKRWPYCTPCFSALKVEHERRPEVKAQRKAARDAPEARSRRWSAKLASEYGLPREHYDRLLIAQAGRCHACNAPATQQAPLVVDHHHRTGRVRALLCNPCNQALGLVAERPEVLESLARYVREFEALHCAQPPTALEAFADRAERAGDPPFWRRILSKISTGDEHWLWHGPVNARGQARANRHGQKHLVLQLLWEQGGASVPEGHVLRPCAVERCVRPEHAHLERWEPATPQPPTKLSATQVEEIRRRYGAGGVSLRALAREYGVVHHTIALIVSGKMWNLPR